MEKMFPRGFYRIVGQYHSYPIIIHRGYGETILSPASCIIKLDIPVQRICFVFPEPYPQDLLYITHKNTMYYFDLHHIEDKHKKIFAIYPDATLELIPLEGV